MNRRVIFSLSVLLLMGLSLGAFAQQYSYDYEEMEMDVYFAELSKWQKREADANAAIAEEEAKIASLGAEEQAHDAEIANCWNKIYSMLGTDEAGYNDFVNQAKALESDLNGFVALSPENIYSRMDELEEYENRLAALRSDKRSLGPDGHAILQRVEALIEQAKEKASRAIPPSYTVVRGDYLWKIAGLSETYSDPYAWMRIYTANRDQIKDPDLIYPNQTFAIPRNTARNEHLVARGETLRSIASANGNAFSWQQLYQANRDVIGDDATKLYPHMVLRLP